MTRITRRMFLRLAGAAGAAALLPARITTAQDAPLVIDGHLDLGWNISNYGRDYVQSAYTLRGHSSSAGAGAAMVGLPELLAGRVALVLGIIFVMPASHANAGHIARYSTADEAHDWGLAMLSGIEDLAARSPQITIVRTRADLDAVLATWQPDQPENARQVGIMLGMEGADPIRTPDELADWHARGLRSVGLSWGRTRYAGSNSDPGDLTAAGRALLTAMAAHNMIFDTAHLSEAAFWSAIPAWQGPVSYSHGNSRYFLPSERGLSDDQIWALVARDGVIGIGAYDWFFERRRIAPGDVTLADMVNAIDYVCQLTGTCAHVAIGSDADGGFGAEQSPLDTVADLPQIGELLAGRSYTADDIAAILHGNWLRVWRAALPEK